jgi:hypothetical protein
MKKLYPGLSTFSPACHIFSIKEYYPNGTYIDSNSTAYFKNIIV